MKITVIITAILFVYAAFSTFFSDASMVGGIGRTIGQTNIALFGYLAYVSIFILFYPLYKTYKDKNLFKDLDFYLAWMLFCIALILFVALIANENHIGYVGTQIVSFLRPLIGTAGLWLFWLMIVSLFVVFVMDDDYFSLELDNLFPDISLPKFDISDKVKVVSDTVKTLFVNPFSSPSLSDEMMPMAEEEYDDEIVRPAITQTKRKPTVKKVEPVVEEIEEAEEIDEIVLEEESYTFIDDAFDEIVPSRPVKKEKTVVAPKRKVKVEKVPVVKAEKTPAVKIVKELEENSKLMAQIDKGARVKPKNFKLPKIDFLQQAPKIKKKINEAEIDRKIEELLSKLQQFRVDGDVIRTYSGPLVTTFEFKPAPNVKVSKILGLQDDLAMALSAETIRIQAPIPGRDVVGIEIPNESIDTIYLREILESSIFKNASSPLTVALGKDIVGNPFITDLKKLPHVLIAGTTGSGKSVGINAMILSLLYRNDPDNLKLMLIDPKMLEFSMYNDIPHLITPVITEPMKAIAALANMVGEMERRYKLMADSRTKNIENYNEKVKKENSAEEFPYIVIVIDELADLMMNGGKEVELSIARLAQKSRACGIHLIVATQRPSVDVVTGLIKANLPSRLSYRVGQRIDSKVILDAMGAESLLGRGDGLFTPPGATGLVRIHAPWNTEDEIDKVVEFLKAQRAPDYDESYLVVGGASANSSDKSNEEIVLDPLYEEAKSVVLNDQKTSISYLQRKLQIGYNRSANIIEQLEFKGVLSAPNAKGNREIL